MPIISNEFIGIDDIISKDDSFYRKKTINLWRGRGISFLQTPSLALLRTVLYVYSFSITFMSIFMLQTKEMKSSILFSVSGLQAFETLLKWKKSPSSR